MSLETSLSLVLLPGPAGRSRLLSALTTRWQQSPPFPGSRAPSAPSLAADPSLASPRNLAAIQDREICCYSISCKEKDNIGAWVGGRRVRLSGRVSRWWLPEPVTPPRCRGPQQGGPPSSGVLGLCDLGQVATWALTSPPVTAGVAPALHLSTPLEVSCPPQGAQP